MAVNDLACKIAVLEETVRQHELRAAAAFHARDLALIKASDAIAFRLDSMNEFRAQLTEQANKFLSKDEYQYHHNVLQDKVEKLTDQLLPLTQGNILERLTRNTDVITLLTARRESGVATWSLIAGLTAAMASIAAVVSVFWHGSVPLK